MCKLSQGWQPLAVPWRTNGRAVMWGLEGQFIRGWMRALRLESASEVWTVNDSTEIWGAE